MRIALRKNKSILVCLLAFTMCSMSNAQGFIDLESGIIFTGFNTVRAPGKSGTSISLKDDLPVKPTPFFRLRVGINFNERHHVSALYAPLTAVAKGSLNTPVTYRNNTFAANTELEARYTFNSYRLTYNYSFIQKPKLNLGMGLSAKIRDAGTFISGGGITEGNTNIGFVPLINLQLNWMPTEHFGLRVFADGLVAAQGRAEDVLVTGIYKVNDKLNLNVGYHFFEGGSDGASAYNFVLLHYAVAGVTYAF